MKFWAIAAVAASQAWAGSVPATRDLVELSLEQIADIEVTSVSRRAERLGEAPASVFVITGDDIRRSGARTLPDVLRLAPNLQVAQSSGNDYRIRARGFYNTSANKLLVLIDGRSVYSPLFAGVFWDVQELVLEDIERIEVISGPGGTLWGVNAVSGVVNVITRSARDSQGVLVAGAAGSRQADGATRYGGPLAGGHYRVFARYLDREHTQGASGAPLDDASHLRHAGFRGDWDGARGRLMVQGNAYRGSIGQPRPGSVQISGVVLPLAAIAVSGANLNASWTSHPGTDSQIAAQVYLDRTERTVPPTFAEKLDLLDVQIQHTKTWAGGHAVAWGAQHRRGDDRLTNSQYFAFLPADVKQAWSSLFVQGDVALEGGWRITAGARFERNDYTGWEFLPNVRVAWKVAPDHLLWSAASRTVRAPSRLDRDPFIPGQPPYLLAGGPEVPAEVANVYEVGLRGQWAGLASYSLTVYHSDNERLHTQELAPSRTFITFGGGLEGRSEGLETWGSFQATDRWRISAGYAAQRERLRLAPGSNDAAALRTSGRDPAHAWLLRSSFSVSPRIEIDATVRGVAALANPVVPRYRTLDVRVGWRVLTGLEVWLAGRNLADGGHGEFGDLATRTEVERSFHMGLRWQFDRP